MQRPTDAEIAKVVSDLKVDWIQAYRHVQQRHRLVAAFNLGSPQRRLESLLGKSALYAGN